MRWKLIPTLLVAGILLLLARGCFFRDGRQEILALLDTVRRLAEVEKEEPVFVQLGRAKEIADHFSEPCAIEWRIDQEEHREQFTSRGQIRERVLAARRSLDKLAAALQDADITLAADGSAAADVTVSAMGSMPDIEGGFFDRHRVRIELQKVDGRWLISKLRHLENLRAVPTSTR